MSRSRARPLIVVTGGGSGGHTMVAAATIAQLGLANRLTAGLARGIAVANELALSSLPPHLRRKAVITGTPSGKGSSPAALPVPQRAFSFARACPPSWSPAVPRVRRR